VPKWDSHHVVSAAEAAEKNKTQKGSFLPARLKSCPSLTHKSKRSPD